MANWFENKLISLFREFSERRQKFIIDKIRQDDLLLYELIKPYECAWIPEKYYNMLNKDATSIIFSERAEEEENKPRETMEDAMERHAKDREAYKQCAKWRKEVDVKHMQEKRIGT